ncbi:PREDICTED: UDP-glucuronosyltransferase 1-9-like [Eufriesea mexicana]|uniref:UDP-glucuronosyltransferase 1-9-like n=1 Tax=Eufriesea mexicana TaxID=516756 RepID=UPI00083C3C20|nr:PREDICTED: UDP-glucuronosyltransferase 1-9-like [Eufriesea mexicana]
MKLLLSILLALSVCGWCDGLRILGLFPLNGKSHWVMAERLMVSLAERGHEVDVVTHFPLKNPPLNYNQISLEGSLPSVVNNLNASNVTSIKSNDLKLLTYMAGDQICQLMGHPKLQSLIKNSPKKQYDVIVLELFMMPCYLAFSRHLKAPIVGVMTSGFHDWLSSVTGNPHNPSYMPCLFAPFSQRMTFWERLQNTLLTNMITWKMKYYLSYQDAYVKKYLGMDVVIDDLYQDIGAILVNTHHSIGGINPTTSAVIEVGGLHVNENSSPLSPEVKKWLDESTHGCIFFTFGSMVKIETFPKPFLESLYKAFERIAPVRVLMKVVKKEDLLPGLPKNVMIQPWYSQVSVFKHKNVKAFITHGGLMGSLEAIHFGIPMIGIPLFGDQHTNLKRAANMKIAVNLESIDNVNEENLYNAIDAILHDETYRSNIKKVSQLFKDRPMSAIDTAIYWIEYVARNGYFLRSPVIDLTWWQRNLLDVYGFLLACLLLILGVSVFLVCKLKNYLLGCKSCTKKGNQPHESKKKK